MGREESCPNPAVRLVADIGGTDARFALLSEDRRPTQILSLPCADYPELAAADEFEDIIVAILRRRFGHVSAERTLSGPGLIALYETVVELNGGVARRLTPETVAQRALEPALTRTP